MSVEDLQVFLDRYTKCKIQDNIKVSQERKTLYIIICVLFELKDILDLPVQWANTVSWDRLRLRPFFVQHWRFGVTLASGVVGVRGLVLR